MRSSANCSRKFVPRSRRTSSMPSSSGVSWAGRPGPASDPLAALAAGLSKAPTTHTVEIRGMEFHPAELPGAVGDPVVWINRDIVPHPATGSGRTKWDTGQLLQGQKGRYVASSRGTKRYACAFHPTMHGTLIVR